MADFYSSSPINADEKALFDYLSDVSNLPQYFTRMTSATAGDGTEVHTTAKLPNGNEVEGDAWFETDAAANTIKWGSEGPSSYHGSLTVSADGDDVRVEVRLHTTRVPDGDGEVQQGLDKTVETIKRLAEEFNSAPSVG